MTNAEYQSRNCPVQPPIDVDIADFRRFVYKVVENNRGLFRLDYWPELGVYDASRDSI